jgi:hypothetical protein
MNCSVTSSARTPKAVKRACTAALKVSGKLPIEEFSHKSIEKDTPNLAQLGPSPAARLSAQFTVIFLSFRCYILQP